MNNCPSCNIKINYKTKIKLWYLIPKKCTKCGRELKLNKNKLFTITINTTILAVILIFVLNYLDLNIFLNGAIVLSFGLLVPIPFITYFVDYRK